MFNVFNFFIGVFFKQLDLKTFSYSRTGLAIDLKMGIKILASLKVEF